MLNSLSFGMKTPNNWDFPQKSTVQAFHSVKYSENSEYLVKYSENLGYLV